MSNRTPYTSLIVQAASNYSLPVDILEAQILQESNGRADAFRFEQAFYERYIKMNPMAVGFKYGPLAACSFGLMQIMLETAMESGYLDRPELLFMPRVGLNWGARYMKSLVDWAAGDIEQALAAYNGGKGGNTQRPFRNNDYVTQVLARVAGRPSSPLNA